MQRRTQFLVNPQGTAPKTLEEAIVLLEKSSIDFCSSWKNSNIQLARKTSEEAFTALDHIQNELLRHRDEKQQNQNWTNSSFKLALDIKVGDLVNNISVVQKSAFSVLPAGSAILPANSSPNDLTLVKALNKLKHRSPKNVNFTVDSTNKHTLFIFTNGGMGQSSSISKFDLKTLCDACKVVSNIITT